MRVLRFQHIALLTKLFFETQNSTNVGHNCLLSGVLKVLNFCLYIFVGTVALKSNAVICVLGLYEYVLV